MQGLAQSPRDPDFVQNPYPFYARARALGPLFHWEDYGFPCAAGHAAVDALLRDRRFGRELPADLKPPRPPHLAAFYALDDRSMLDREPPVHTRLRRLVLRAFTSRRIAGLAPEIDALARSLAEALPGRFDLLPTFAERLPVIVIARLLGVPDAAADDLLAWSHAMVAMYQARRDAAVEAAAEAAARAFTAFLRDHVAVRRRRPADDLITKLIAAEEAGDRLDTEELIATCVLLLNAGHEATVHAIGNGTAAILAAGLAPQALFADRKSTEATVEEILRFDPPLHLFTRYALDEVEVFGHRFARGDTVGCSSPPPAATRPAFPTPTASTRPGRRGRTSPSAPASISASGRRSPASSSPPRCPCSWRSPASPSTPRRSLPTATTSAASSPCRSAATPPPADDPHAVRRKRRRPLSKKLQKTVNPGRRPSMLRARLFWE